MKFALVTGGSQGIGLAMARECLKQGLAVAIVALPNEHLQAAETELKQYGEVRTLGINLLDPQAADQIDEWLTQEQIELHYLINNAGFGRGGRFEDVAFQEYAVMMPLNTQVGVTLIYKLLPRLKATKGGILNVSSMEATLPLPYKAVYTGTKGFIYNFSLAIREEFRYHGISVSILCPGPVLTNEDGLKRLEAKGRQAKLIVKMPEEVAPPAIKGMLKGKAVIIPGWLPKTLVRVGHYLPRSWRLKLLERTFREYRDNPS